MELAQKMAHQHSPVLLALQNLQPALGVVVERDAGAVAAEREDQSARGAARNPRRARRPVVRPDRPVVEAAK
eukprot:SAG22_NODE_62_length_23371_cov_84.500602_3_plen_72_part_00